MSSWWSVIHGYKHPELNRALISQAEKFAHVMLGGLTHEPVQQLSAKLQEFLPGDLDYCFFSDSGSVAVEVSLKMALQYHVNKGNKRPLVLALNRKITTLPLSRRTALTRRLAASISLPPSLPWRRPLPGTMTS